MVRQWFQITREWIEYRDVLLRAEEDAMIRAARDRAVGDERGFLDALLDERDRNAEAARRRRL